MTATLLRFERPGSSRVNIATGASSTTPEAQFAQGHPPDVPLTTACVSARTMSVAEAAFQVYFASSPGRESVATIARLTGEDVGTLFGRWGGPSGLRDAAIRYALSLSMG